MVDNDKPSSSQTWEEITGNRTVELRQATNSSNEIEVRDVFGVRQPSSFPSSGETIQSPARA